MKCSMKNSMLIMNTPKSKFSRISSKPLTRNDLPEGSVEKVPSPSHSTPNGTICELETDRNSPIFVPYSQDCEDDIEVIWDWHSPQSSTNNARKPKRRLPNKKRDFPSPSLAISMKRKQLIPNNGINDLKEKLEALNRKIDQRNSECIRKSTFTERLNTVTEVKVTNEDTLENIFGEDDSFTECLVQCSQQVEKKYLNENQRQSELPVVVPQEDLIVEKFKDFQTIPEIADDSFDFLLGNLKDDVILTIPSNTVINSSSTGKCVESEYRMSSYDFGKQSAGISENFQSNINPTIREQLKTDLECPTQFTATIPLSPTFRCTPEEIEKKRREALAKLERKLKARSKSSNGITVPTTPRHFQQRNYSFESNSSISSNSLSPPYRSFEEIDKNRREAKEKLMQGKKIQEEIERKKQEAIARLQRKKQMMTEKKFTFKKP